MFKIYPYSLDIDRVEVSDEIDTRNCCYFDTWDDAFEALVARTDRAMRDAATAHKIALGQMKKLRKIGERRS